MKTLLLILLCFTLSSFSLADSGATGSKINEFEMGHESLAKVESGSVLINTKESSIQLRLQEPWSCPDGLYCAAVMPEPIVIEHPIAVQFKDYCGIKKYVAFKQITEEDPNQETLIVEDHRDSTCPSTKDVKTLVEYHTYSIKEGAKTSRFYADELNTL